MHSLYKITKEKPWSEVIKERRLRLLGHICRLPADTPARQSITEALRPSKKKPGRPKLTWIQQTKQDLEKIGISADNNFSNVIEIAGDRDIWKAKTGNLHCGGQPSEM